MSSPRVFSVCFTAQERMAQCPGLAWAASLCSEGLHWLWALLGTASHGCQAAGVGWGAAAKWESWQEQACCPTQTQVLPGRANRPGAGPPWPSTCPHPPAI